MKIKNKGKCAKCDKVYSFAKGISHLFECVFQSVQPSKSTEEGYLMKISCSENSNLYWMFISISQKASLRKLDQFLEIYS